MRHIAVFGQRPPSVQCHGPHAGPQPVRPPAQVSHATDASQAHLTPAAHLRLCGQHLAPANSSACVSDRQCHSVSARTADRQYGRDLRAMHFGADGAALVRHIAVFGQRPPGDQCQGPRAGPAVGPVRRPAPSRSYRPDLSCLPWARRHAPFRCEREGGGP